MRRILSILMVLAMMLSLAACTSNKPAETPDASPEQSTVDTPDASPEQSTTPDASQTPVDGETPAYQLLAEFKNIINSGTPYACESVAAQLIENEELIPFAGAHMAVEPGFLNGFTEEIDGFEEGETFGPMIGSIPFVGYIFQVPEGDDVNAFMENLKSKADLRWNICTAADEMVVDAVGNTVFFVMAPATFDDAQ